MLTALTSTKYEAHHSAVERESSFETHQVVPPIGQVLSVARNRRMGERSVSYTQHTSTSNNNTSDTDLFTWTCFRLVAE